MQQGRVVDLDGALALASAKAGVEHKLPLADSIVYATAQAEGGVVWTQDEDFDGLPGVKYHSRPAGKS
jgi:predicted nucleic acid-binding protein